MTISKAGDSAPTRLGYLIDCYRRVALGVRQIDRFNRAVTGGEDASVQERCDEVDQEYFLFVAAAHAAKAHALLVSQGEPVPDLGQVDLIREMRNIEEHWDAPHRGQVLGALRRWTGKRWNDDDKSSQVLRMQVGSRQATGGYEVRSINSIDLRQLRTDLLAVEDWLANELGIDRETRIANCVQ